MTTVAMPSPVMVGTSETRIDFTITRRAFKQVWKGATVCAAVFGITVASSALTYVTTFPTEASRQQIALITGNDVGMSMLLGPISGMNTVGGYTVYKTFTFLTTIGAIWALLAATRLLRGEEDAGRWQVVLAGGTQAARATAATIVALTAAVVIVFVGTLLCTIAAGSNPDVAFRPGASLLYALSVTLVAPVFVGVGAVTSQLGRTRRVATALGMGVFGVTYVVRMLADSGPDTHWLLWATPFGWSELMTPLTQADLRPLVPAALTVVALYGAAIVLSGRRDVGDGVFAARDVSPVRPFGLRSSFGLAVRLERGVLAAWLAGIAAAGFVFGIIAKITTTSIPTSMTDMLDKFGVQGSFIFQYLGVAFLMQAALVALLPASQIGAACDEETSGRLVHVLASPIERRTWFVGRLVITAAAVVVAAILSGFFAWLGAASQGVDLDFGSLMYAGVNVIPSAIVVLGIGSIVLAVAPRAAAGTVYAIIVWSFLAYLLGSMITAVSWIDRLSLYHYMALAPATTPEPSTLAITAGIGLVLCAIATLLFEHRDVRTG